MHLFILKHLTIFIHKADPHFSKQNKFQSKTIIATGETVDLVEWIINDTCLV